jgi:bifunctional enzyme CysN/CysC
MLLNDLETVHTASDRNLLDMRLPVQYVSRPDADTRGYMGTTASGILRPGDEVLALPSGPRSRVRRLADASGDLPEAFPPMPVTVFLEDAIDVSRGDMLVHPNNVPRVGRTLEAMIVWMAAEPFTPGKTYTIKHASRMTPARMSALRYRVDVDTLHRVHASSLGLNEIGRAVLELGQPIAYDPYGRNRATGALIIIDRVTNGTVGAGMILPHEANPVVLDPARLVGEPLSSDLHLHAGSVSPAQRAFLLGQEPCTVWITGLTGTGKTTIAYALERRLFDAGRVAAVLDGENLRLGLGRDLGFAAAERAENLRRAAEVARMFNQAGLITICALVSPFAEARRRAREIVGTERMVEVYLTAPDDVRRRRAADTIERAERGQIESFTGVSSPYEVPPDADLVLATHELSVEECVERILALMRRRGLAR